MQLQIPIWKYCTEPPVADTVSGHSKSEQPLMCVKHLLDAELQVLAVNLHMQCIDSIGALHLLKDAEATCLLEYSFKQSWVWCLQKDEMDVR